MISSWSTAGSRSLLQSFFVYEKTAISLASMMQNLTFFRQGTEEQLGNKMKKAVNDYDILYTGANRSFY